MKLRRYVFLLRRWIWVFVLFSFLGATIAFVFSRVTTPVYRSSTTMLINQAPSTSPLQDYNSMLASGLLAKTYKELLVKQPLMEGVIANLKLPITSEVLISKITVDIVRDTQLLNLSVEDTNPQQAAIIANEIANEFNIQNQQLQKSRYASTEQSLQDELNKIQTNITQTQANLDTLKTSTSPEQSAEQLKLQASLSEYRTSYSNLLKSLEDVRLAEAQASNDLRIVERATPSIKPIRPTTLVNIIIGGGFSLILAMGLVLLLDYLDDSIKVAEQIEQLVGVSTLGILPRFKGNNSSNKVVSLSLAASPVAEAYRVLRANIEFAEVDSSIRTLVICSALSTEGKSTVATNLAVTIAQSGKRVILVDTDLRRPTIHNYFKKSNARGVTNVLLEQNGSVLDYLVPTPLDNLKLLLSGPIPPNPAELLNANRMLELIEELKLLSDIVIFDTSPLMPVVDATLLARVCDSSLMVVHAGSTRSVIFAKGVQRLLQSGTRLLGVVLNQVENSTNGYYSYEYGQYNSQENGRRWNFFVKKTKRNKRKKKNVSNESNQLNLIMDNSNKSNELIVKNANLQTRFAADSGELDSVATLSTTKLLEVSVEGGIAFSQITSSTTATETEITLPKSLQNQLEVICGPCQAKKFTITGEHALIGRLRKSTLSAHHPSDLEQTVKLKSLTEEFSELQMFFIEDETISPEHAELFVKTDGIYLRDLESTTGTWVNNKKLKNEFILLADGDQIRLGSNTTLIFHSV